MTDYFALLDVPRQPWLEPAELKKRFLSLSAELHPDRVHGANEPEKRAAQSRYAELNSAFQCLNRPRDRLRHLLELETGSRGEQILNVPPMLMDFFLQFSSLCRQVDAFLTEKAAAQSPLLQVQLFERAQEWTIKISAMQKRLNQWRQDVETALKQLDARWLGETQPQERADILSRLEEIARTFGFVERWSSQAQERFVQLSL